jgi:hypothetical protein
LSTQVIRLQNDQLGHKNEHKNPHKHLSPVYTPQVQPSSVFCPHITNVRRLQRPITDVFYPEIKREALAVVRQIYKKMNRGRREAAIATYYDAFGSQLREAEQTFA